MLFFLLTDTKTTSLKPPNLKTATCLQISTKLCVCYIASRLENRKLLMMENMDFIYLNAFEVGCSCSGSFLDVQILNGLAYYNA